MRSYPHKNFSMFLVKCGYHGNALAYPSYITFRHIYTLKHKGSFGKSENLSKIFFAEILVFDHDYVGKSSSSNGLL